MDDGQNEKLQFEFIKLCVSVMDLGKFNPDDFETHETAFINLLAQTYGVEGENLKYIVRDVVIPAEFVDDAEWCMYQLPLTGKAYSMDNKSVYRLLKSFLINTSGWTWIEPYDTMENGRRAFLAWTSHYNGQGELSKHTAMAKARVKSLFYKNKHSLSFEKVMEILSKSFLHWIRTQTKGTQNVRRWKSYFCVFRCQTWKWWHRSR
jgi:hypothetical protein